MSDKNREHYDAVYSKVTVSRLVDKLRKLPVLWEDISQTDTSWFGLYHDHFEKRLTGARILELGAGNGLNALIMASHGAKVTALDISGESANLIRKASFELGLTEKVEAITSDFLKADFVPESFDFIIGKAFLHHLTGDLIERYLAKISELLRKDGEARFFEPAINSRFLDGLRWIIPVRGRPSSLNRSAFASWKKSDPHPEGNCSSEYYRELSKRYFGEIRIVPVGGIERLHRLLPAGPFSRSFRRWALQSERVLPYALRLKIARSQTIILRLPHQPDTTMKMQ